MSWSLCGTTRVGDLIASVVREDCEEIESVGSSTWRHGDMEEEVANVFGKLYERHKVNVSMDEEKPSRRSKLNS